MPIIHVKSLWGAQHSFEVTPADKICKLTEHLDGTTLQGCRLMLRGSALAGSRTIASLDLQAGEFLTAVAVRKAGGTRTDPQVPATASSTTSTAPSRAGISTNPASLNSRTQPSWDATQHSSCAAVPQLLQALDSLLPGYVSRPNPSPRKPLSLGTAFPNKNTMTPPVVEKPSAQPQSHGTEMQINLPSTAEGGHITVVEHKQQQQRQSPQLDDSNKPLIAGEKASAQTRMAPPATSRMIHPLECIQSASAVADVAAMVPVSLATVVEEYQHVGHDMHCHDDVLAQLRQELAESVALKMGDIHTHTSPASKSDVIGIKRIRDIVSLGDTMVHMASGPSATAAAGEAFQKPQHDSLVHITPSENNVDIITIASDSNGELASKPKRHRGVHRTSIQADKDRTAQNLKQQLPAGTSHQPQVTEIAEQQPAQPALRSSVHLTRLQKLTGEQAPSAAFSQGTLPATPSAATYTTAATNTSRTDMSAVHPASSASQRSHVSKHITTVSNTTGLALEPKSLQSHACEQQQHQIPDVQCLQAPASNAIRAQSLAARKRVNPPLVTAASELQARALELDAVRVRLPLPPVLQRLDSIFTILSTIYAFQLSKHLQATWGNSSGALQAALPGQSVIPADILTLTQLAPAVVRVRGWLHTHDAAAAYHLHQGNQVEGQRQEDQQKRSAESELENQPGHTLKQQQQPQQQQQKRIDVASVWTDLGAVGSKVHASTQSTGVPEAAGISREAGPLSGTPVSTITSTYVGSIPNMGPSAIQNKAESHSRQSNAMVIELVDPGRTVKLPTMDQLAMHSSTEIATLSAANNNPDELKPAKPPKSRANAQSRRIASVRIAMVNALLALHADFVMQLPIDKPLQPVADTAEAAAVTACTDVPESIAASIITTNTTTTSVIASPDASCDSSNTADWDPLVRGSWHPAFPLTGITLQQVLSAAAAGQRQEQLQLALLDRDKREGAAGPQWQANYAGAPRPPTLLKSHPPCLSTVTLDCQSFLRHLQTLKWYNGQVVHVERMPSRKPRCATPSYTLLPPVHKALASRGVSSTSLFTHQAAAIDSLLSSKHTVIATSTASGKSLCYLVPILQVLAQDRNACALLLFPTKALAQDQRRALQELVTAAFGEEDAPIIGVYDGDTPKHERAAVRESAQLLITNPDMLHMSILPMHHDFTRVLGNLRYVVVDEGHAYKGVFGSHTALVLRRLRRICAHVHHISPCFAVTSATIANPQTHAMTLLGVPSITLIEDDGSPHGEKDFVLWNPPLSDPPPKPTEENVGATAKEAASAASAAAASAAATLDYPPNSGLHRQMAASDDASNSEHVQASSAASVLQVSKLTALRSGIPGFQQAGRVSHTESRKSGRSNQRAAKDAMRWALREAAAPRTMPLSQPQASPGLPRADMKSAIGQALTVVKVRAELKKRLFGSPSKVAERQTAVSYASSFTTTGSASAEAAGSAADAPALNQDEDDGDEVIVCGAAPITATAAGVAATKAKDVVSVPEGALLTAAAAAEAKKREQLRSDALAAISRVSSAPIRFTTRAGVLSAGLGQGSSNADRDGITHTTAAPRKLKMLEPAPLLAHLLGLKQQQQLLEDDSTDDRHSAPASARQSGSKRPNQRGSQPVPVSGVPADVEAAILARLPGPEWRERYGVAGVSSDQRRASPIVEVALLLAECVQHGLRTIAFCKSRKLCELVAAYCRETLKCTAPEMANAVQVYRGGYSPAERRRIESDLHAGRIRGVAATNALELGIDIGSLDVTLHLGFQGSLASMRQQSGRAGRREQRSLALYVAFDGPLDQHFMRHPEDVFGRPNEAAQVDTSNLELLQQHLTCAAAELPLFPEEDTTFFGPHMIHAVSALRAAGLLSRHPHSIGHRTLHYVGPRPNPAADVSLRTIDPERYAIVNEDDGSVMESIEANTAFYEVYDGAVYLYQGRPYLCSSLDLHSRVAKVRAADVKYYTKLRDFTDVHVTGGRVAYRLGALAPLAPQLTSASDGVGIATGQPIVPHTTAVCESALVTTRFLGYYRVLHGSGKTMDAVDLYLPDVRFATQAAFVRLPRTAGQQCRELGLSLREGCHAASHALLAVLPLYLCCNSGDVKTECDNPYDTRYRIERLLIFDATRGGGLGFSAAAAPLFTTLLQRALKLVTECGCTSAKGCPSCVQHTTCSNYNAVICKAAAEVVLRCVLEQECAVDACVNDGSLRPRGLLGIGGLSAADEEDEANNMAF